jgi:diguanylate cyclase (GGDEF)-like protein
MEFWTQAMPMIFMSLPAFVWILIWVAARGHLSGQSSIGVRIAVFLAVLSIILGIQVGACAVGLLYAVLFLGTGLFPVSLRRAIVQARRDYRPRQVLLERQIHQKKLEYKECAQTQGTLMADLNQISKRYAFARTLAAHTDEQMILSDFSTLFMTEERSIQSIVFLKPGELSASGSQLWDPIFSNGTVSTEGWKKILPALTIQPDAFAGHAWLVPSEKGFEHSAFSHIEGPGGAFFVAGVPISWRGDVQGLVLFLLRSEPAQSFLDEVSVYAQLLGFGLHKASLYRMMLERSRTDGLTGLYLRRVFLERLADEVNFSKRYGTSFSLLMMDLDHFKRVNDAYGHLAGDVVLRSVAQCMKSTLHPGVSICRYGGEEFAVLIGLAPSDEVVEIAKNLKNAVSRLEMQVSETAKLKITVSIGVAHFLPTAPPPDELIRRADEALYEAKATGRNRVREWKEIQRENPA